jgi:hypothetical protein
MHARKGLRKIFTSPTYKRCYGGRFIKIWVAKYEFLQYTGCGMKISAWPEFNHRTQHSRLLIPKFPSWLATAPLSYWSTQLLLHLLSSQAQSSSSRSAQSLHPPNSRLAAVMAIDDLINLILRIIEIGSEPWPSYAYTYWPISRSYGRSSLWRWPETLLRMRSPAIHRPSASRLFVSASSMLCLFYFFLVAFNDGLVIFPWLSVVLDALNTLFFFAAAVALAAKLHVHSCDIQVCSILAFLVGQWLILGNPGLT